APARAPPAPPIPRRMPDPPHFSPAIPTTALCVTQWAANCRIIINYPQHLQPLWDAPRPNPPLAGVNNTCSQGGCHNAKDAAGAAQTPAGNLDLTNTPSQAVPPEHTSHPHVPFPPFSPVS